MDSIPCSFILFSACCVSVCPPCSRVIRLSMRIIKHPILCLRQGYPFDLDDPETMNFFIKYARPMTGGRPSGPPPPLHRGPPVGRGGPDLGSARGPPPMMAGRGGGMMMEGRGRGGRGGELQGCVMGGHLDVPGWTGSHTWQGAMSDGSNSYEWMLCSKADFSHAAMCM